MHSRHSWIGNLRRGLLLLSLLSLSHPTLADDLLAQAQTLIDQGKEQAAYQLLAPQENERAGDPRFDLLLGIAAIESGKHTLGVLALERVLATEPGNARARAEIGRAYLNLGETDVARAEFNSLRELDLPESVARNIDKYLDAVDRIDYTTRTTLRGYLEATLGHDSNVNVGPNRNSVAIPGFGGLPFTLSEDSKANADEFGTLAGGMTLRHPLTPQLAITAGLNGWEKITFHESQFNTSNVDGNLGLVVSQDRHEFSATYQHQEFWVNDKGFRVADGLTGQWQYSPTARDQFSAYLQYSDLAYDDQRIRDADRWVVGGAYAHALKTGEILYASLYKVDEREEADYVPFLGYEGYGFRLGAQTAASKPLIFFGNVSLEHRRYGGEDPAFLDTREDMQYDLNLGATYRLDRHWSVSPRFSYTRNDSNIELNEYHREIYSFTLRRDF